MDDVPDDRGVPTESNRQGDWKGDLEFCGAALVLRVNLGRKVAKVSGHVLAHGLFERVDMFLCPVDLNEDAISDGGHAGKGYAATSDGAS
jgi:hypothetical protein